MVALSKQVWRECEEAPLAAQSRYAELARRLNSIGTLRRALVRLLPADCPSGTAAALALLQRHGELRLVRLAELLAVDLSVTSRHVAYGVTAGWIERTPDPDDGRSRLLRPTPAGHALLAELHRGTTEVFSDRLAGWTDEDLGQLITLLTRLQDAFGDCRPERADRPGTPRPAAAPPPRQAPASP
jgi:DNA-binding MarR family transcriptional regulator